MTHPIPRTGEHPDQDSRRKRPATTRSRAEKTGGQYYRAESADQLQDALGDLPSHVTVTTEHVDIASWFAAAGGLLVITALGLSLWWNRVRTSS